MTTRQPITLSLFAILATGCAAAPTGNGPCAMTQAIGATGIEIGATRMMAEWDEESGEIELSHSSIDCATFTVTDPDSNWRVTGVTPAEVDLAPGSYEVEVDFADDNCDYVSDVFEVDVTDDFELVYAPLCANMAGMWTCETLRSETFVEARMDGCTLELDGLPTTAQVQGHLIQGDDFTGVVDIDARSMHGTMAGDDMSCWR